MLPGRCLCEGRQAAVVSLGNGMAFLVTNFIQAIQLTDAKGCLQIGHAEIEPQLNLLVVPVPSGA